MVAPWADKGEQEQCAGCEQAAREHLAWESFPEALSKGDLVQSEFFCSKHGVIHLATMLSREDD